MKVLDLVRERMWRYPTLHPNRTMALLSALTYSGAGWQNGELYVDDPPPTEEKHFIDPEQSYQRWLSEETVWDAEKRERRQVHESELSESTRQSLRKLSADDARETAEVRLNIDEKIVTPGPLEIVSWIPSYAPIVNLPGNITDEWLDAVEEVAKAIYECDSAGGLAKKDDQQPKNPEVRRAMFIMLSDILAEAEGKPKPSEMSPEDFAAYEAEAREEHRQRVEGEKMRVKEHKETAQMILTRVEKIRKDRNARTA